MTSKVHGDPAHNDGHCAVAATRDQKESTVLGMVVSAVDVQQDPVSCHCDKHGDQCKGEPMLHPIRQEGDQHGEAKCCCPWWN